MKKLVDMNLIDNFLFGSVMTYPMYGKKLAEMLLKDLYGREFNELIVVPQKIYYGSQEKYHGVRLDVYLEETGEPGTIYDIEPEKNDSPEAIKALPRRIRFYHSKIDEKCLKSGESYDKLKNVIIIMIMPFDPVGKNKMIYTAKTCFIEDVTIPYEDGARTILLNTKGNPEGVSESLVELLHYIEESRRENVVNDQLSELHNMVETVKHDSEVSTRYMKMMEEYERMLKEAEEKGMKLGEEKGMKLGEEKGMKLGEEKGMKLGEEKGMKLGEEKGLKLGIEKGEKMVYDRIRKCTSLEEVMKVVNHESE